MKLQRGFAPIAILLIAAISSLAVLAGYSITHQKTASEKQILFLSPTPISTITPIPSPTPSHPPVKYIPTLTPLPTKSSTATIMAAISNNGSPVSDTAPYLFVRNEDTAHEQILKNGNSNWIITGITPGKYKVYIAYSINSFMNPEISCQGCQNPQNISGPGSCGYIVELSAGDTMKLSCELRPVMPLSGQVSNNQLSNDTTPPNTNIYYPQPDGSITYKIDGQVCAIATQPNDNSGPEGIETEYKFDDGNWSGYAGGRGYLCTPTLANGPHTLYYHSKDRAGNVEETKSLQFTVNIPGN